MLEIMTARRLAALVSLLAAAACLSTKSIAQPVVETTDVARFYRIYESADGRPTAASLQRDYLEAGSPGLRHLARIRNVTGGNMAKAIAAHPEIFARARRCLVILPKVRLRALAALARLRTLYPRAKFPPITIAVSRGKPVGAADSSGVMIGLEALCAVDYLGADLEERFVHTITHEYVHVQQALRAPAFYSAEKPSVLQSSLIEGAADFTAALINGEAYKSPYAPMDAAQVPAIQRRFVTDEDKTDLSDWIDNGSLTVPGDLGYWVGYCIVKSYYDHATNKRQALRDIIELHDAKAFLARSGWSPAPHSP